jgi:UDP-N-acetylglucosamine 2-epimerase (non-hydrolysing)
MEDSQKIRVTTILGTRPEIIRLSEIIKKLEVNYIHRLVFSSQNRETFVGMDFFEELGLKSPDYVIKNTSETTSEFLATLFVKIEQELTNNRPDAVVILGDTNTSLSSIIVQKLGIPIYHIEAGNRSFDSNVPEEVNRKIVDHISDFNLAYSRHAESNLLSEGLNARNCIVIGTPLREVIHVNRSRINESQVLDKLELEPQNYFLVSSHRQENINSIIRLTELVKTLNAIAERFNFPVIVTMHPRLKSMLAKNSFDFHKLVKFVQPFGFIDYCQLQLNAKVVLSDSGSISEESALLNFKAITLRDSMERPEALESGSIVMSGLMSERVISAINFLRENSSTISIPDDYQIMNSSDRVLNFIQSTYFVRDFWSGRH